MLPIGDVVAFHRYDLLIFDLASISQSEKDFDLLLYKVKVASLKNEFDRSFVAKQLKPITSIGELVFPGYNSINL